MGEITPEAAAFYAYMTNSSLHSPDRVATLVEDTLNTQKNNGIGLEHLFCAEATASNNYSTMMWVAQILWILTCRGCLLRLYDWARRATEQGLARAVWEGLRLSPATRLAAPGPDPFQFRMNGPRGKTPNPIPLTVKFPSSG